MRLRFVIAVLFCLIAANCLAAEVCFVQISDLHIKDQASADYLARAVEWLNNPQTFGKNKPSFAAVTGDLSTSGLEEELALCKAALDKLGIPYYVLPGNHDLSDEHPSFEKVFPGRTRYSANFGGCRFLFDLGQIEESADGGSSALEKWLESEVSSTPEDTPVVLLTHYPYGKGVKYSVAGRKKVIKVLKSRKLMAVLSGHFHGSSTVVEDGILFKTIPCLTNTRGNHDGTTAKGAALYVVDENSISANFLQFPE